jgi:seryl-tRNA synthetase
VIVLNNDRRGEMSQSTRERINLQISSINNLMARNNKLIAQLTKDSKNANVKNASLLKAIVVLNNRLLEKDMDLKRLDEQLQSTNDKVIVLETIGEDLRTQNNQNAASIVELTGSLHTAYYIVGSAKELENLNIIDKKGGILGMGKTKQLKEDFEKTNFTCIDYTDIVIIPVNGNNAKLISNHPAESYYMELDVNMKDYTSNLIILDAEKFWSVSKYLVVTKKV